MVNAYSYFQIIKEYIVKRCSCGLLNMNWFFFFFFERAKSKGTIRGVQNRISKNSDIRKFRILDFGIRIRIRISDIRNSDCWIRIRISELSLRKICLFFQLSSQVQFLKKQPKTANRIIQPFKKNNQTKQILAIFPTRSQNLRFQIQYSIQ